METNKQVEFDFMRNGKKLHAITCYCWLDTLDDYYTSTFVLIYDTTDFNVVKLEKVPYQNHAVCTDNSMVNELRFSVAKLLNVQVPKAENIKLVKI